MDRDLVMYTASVAAAAGCALKLVQRTTPRLPVAVLVGMRGAGKSSAGRAAARILGWDFVDMDVALEASLKGESIPDLVKRRGWPAFRQLELETLLQTLESPHEAAPSGKGLIVACGGGVVETPEAFRRLKEWGADAGSVVVYIDRHIDDIVNYLEADGTRPSLGEPLRDIYARRQPLYADVSTAEIKLPHGCTDFEDAMQELAVVVASGVRCSSGKCFYIFGHPVGMSGSPCIQNAGFVANNVPHRYFRYDSEDVLDVVRKLSLPGTGGGSVTIPHKEAIMKHVDVLQPAAKAIGAVNTLTKLPDGRVSGDNTDWIGIRGQLEALPGWECGAPGRVGLVLGAGGTARAASFAFVQMQFEHVVIFNRTASRAQALADEFGAKESGGILLADGSAARTTFSVCADLAGLKPERLHAIMSTLPAGARFALPEGLLQQHKPALVDAAYRSSKSGSRHTPLLLAARAAGCATVEGLEMLFEQGCAQNEIWSQMAAPRAHIARALLADRHADDADEDKPQNLLREAKA